MASLTSRRLGRLLLPSFLVSLVGVAASCGGSDGSPLLGTPGALGSDSGNPGPAPVATGDSSTPPVPDSGSPPPDSGAGLDASDGGSDGGGSDGGDGGDGGITDAGPDAVAIKCTRPKANCSGNAADGCNVDTSSDNANCGGCGIACAGTCDKGVCPLIQTDGGVAPPVVGDTACIAVDSANVYLANARPLPNGAVSKVPTSGGALTPLAGGLAAPRGIATDGAFVYFTTPQSTGQIHKVAADGATPAVAIVLAQEHPVDVVATSNALYWLNQGIASGSLWTSAKDGTNATQIAGPLSQAGDHLRVNATTAFFTDGAYGVRSAPLSNGDGGAGKVVQGVGARFLDIDGTTVFFSAGALGPATTVVRAPLSAVDDPGTDIAQGQPTSRGVATDGVHVYWANAGSSTNNGEIWRADLDGNNPLRLAQGQNAPACIALDASSVYWLNIGSGAISKTGK